MHFAAGLTIIRMAVVTISAAAVVEHDPRSCTTSSECVLFEFEGIARGQSGGGGGGGGASWRCEMGICVPIPIVKKRNRHAVRNS